MNFLWLPLIFLRFLFVQGTSFKFLQEVTSTCDLTGLNSIANSVVFDSNNTQEITINIDENFNLNLVQGKVEVKFTVLTLEKIHNCNVTENKEITCTFTSVNDLPPGTYEISIKNSADSFCKTNLFLVSVQIASAPSQIIFESLEASDNQCLSRESGTIYIKVKEVNNFNPSLITEQNPMAVYFLSRDTKNDFQVNCTQLNTTYLTCQYQGNTDSPISGNFSLSNILYQENGESKTCLIENRKISIEFTDGYYYIPSEGNELKQKIYYQEKRNVISLKVSDNFPQQQDLNGILFFKNNNEERIDAVEPVKVDNTITITIANSTVLNEGEYSIYFMNKCGREERSPVNVSVNVDIVVAETSSEFCYKNLDSFKLENKDTGRTSAIAYAELISGNNVFNYTCSSLSSPSLDCSNPLRKPSGWYNLSSVYYYNATYNRIETFVIKNSDLILIDDQLVDLKENTNISDVINYNPDNSFYLTFNETFNNSAVKMNVSLKNFNSNSDERYEFECLSVQGQARVRCIVEDPTYLPSGETYLIEYYNDTCKSHDMNNLNHTIETKNMVFGTVHFNANDQKCTNSIKNFTISIQRFSVSAADINGILTEETDASKTIPFECRNISKGETTLYCFVQEGTFQNGSYHVTSIQYTPVGTNPNKKDSNVVVNISSVSTIFYNTNFKELLVNKSIETITLTKNDGLRINYTSIVTGEKDTVFLKEINSGLTVQMTADGSLSDVAYSDYHFPQDVHDGTYNIFVVDTCGKQTELPNNVVLNSLTTIALDLEPIIDSNFCYSGDVLTLSFNVNSIANGFVINSFVFTFKNSLVDETYNITSDDNTFSSNVINSTVNLVEGNKLTNGVNYLVGISKKEQEPQQDQIKLSKISLLNYHTTKDIPLITSTEEQKFPLNQDNKTFTVRFSGEITNGVTISLRPSDGTNDVQVNCQVNNTGYANCEINESSIKGGSYKAYYTDLCNIEHYTNIIIIWSSNNEEIYLGEISLSSDSCTRTVPDFSVLIESGDISQLNNNSISAKWELKEQDLSAELNYNCYININGNELQCSDNGNNTSSVEGTYYISEIYSNSSNGDTNNGVKQLNLIFNKSIIYNPNYIPLQRTREIESVYENKSYFTLSFTEQTVGTQSYPVKLISNGTGDELSSVNLNCTKTNVYDRIVYCYIENPTIINSTIGIYNITYNYCGEYEDTGIQVNFTQQAPRYYITIPEGTTVGSFDLSSSILSFFSPLIVLYFISLL